MAGSWDHSEASGKKHRSQWDPLAKKDKAKRKEKKKKMKEWHSQND